jgi:hypothetical protein
MSSEDGRVRVGDDPSAQGGAVAVAEGNQIFAPFVTKSGLNDFVFVKLQ